MGYTPEEIDEFKRAQLADTNAKVAGIAAALKTQQGQQQNGAQAQGGNNANVVTWNEGSDDPWVHEVPK